MSAGPALAGLIAARLRRGARLWLLPALGIAVAVAFAGGVAAEGTIAGDQAAHSVLASTSPLARSARVTWNGVITAGAAARARDALSALGRRVGSPNPTEVLLLDPVRLDGTVVQVAAIDPLTAWVGASAPDVGLCRSGDCPVLAAAAVNRRTYAAHGVRLTVRGRTALRSAVPLGFAPVHRALDSPPPLLLTGDPVGLDRLPGLGGLYRTESWVTTLDLDRLPSWQLAGFESQLRRTQAVLAAAGTQFTVEGPFAALDQARAQAAVAPRRLALVGGGAAAVLAMFVILAAGGLRQDQREELTRLRAAGARRGQGAAYLMGESAAIALIALISGLVLATIAAAGMAAHAGLPVGGVLTHSLLRPGAIMAVAGAWVIATVVLTLATAVPGPRAADTLTVIAMVGLAFVLFSHPGRGNSAPLLLTPLCALAAAVLVARLVAVGLGLAARIAHRGPLSLRLGLVALARAPAAPAITIAFVTVSIGLAGFALAYRATLLRGAQDQAAQQVPLDATVSPAANFTTPLQAAPLARWQAIAAGAVLPVRRTTASYLSGTASVTVPALGVPAAGLAQIHGWRQSDGSAPLAVLARRLLGDDAGIATGVASSGRVSAPLALPAVGGRLALAARSPALALSVTADLLGPDDALDQVRLGTVGRRAVVLRAHTPAGRWTLAGLQLSEPTGLAATNGHQNGENAGAATQATVTATLGPLSLAGRTVSLSGWRAVGAASAGIGRLERGLDVRFTETGAPGIVAPPAAIDARPVPVLADPRLAATAGAGGRLTLQIDGLPVPARLVGVLRRFPTVPAGSAGFVIADEATLAAALDAQLPGQGRPDELWIATHHLTRLSNALRAGPLVGLGLSVRARLAQRTRSAPIARAVLGTLRAAVGIAAMLAILGLLAALTGPGRDRGAERDLTEQGAGPGVLRAELRMRFACVTVAGVVAGIVLALGLARLAVASVHAATSIAAPQPPLVTVIPLVGFVLVALVALAGLGVTSWVATRVALR